MDKGAKLKEEILWISPTTKYASELESYTNGDTFLNLSKLVSFTFQKESSKMDFDNTTSCINDYMTIDWCERKSAASNRIYGDRFELIRGTNLDLGPSELEIPWMTGCIDDADHVHTLSLNFDATIINDDQKEVNGSEKIGTKVNYETLSENLIFSDIDREIEKILSNSSELTSINRLEYRKKTIPGHRSQWKWALSVPITAPEMEIENPVLTFPFELDPFQKQAIYHLEQGHSVFISAHTSAGKTLVAEYAAAMALSKLTKAIYTSPIKALSNQKYREFSLLFGSTKSAIKEDHALSTLDKSSSCSISSENAGGCTSSFDDGDLDPFIGCIDDEISLSEKIEYQDPSSASKEVFTVVNDNEEFSGKPSAISHTLSNGVKDKSNSTRRQILTQRHSVGLLTGDMQVNTDASLLVMTTEILRSMLYRNSPLLSDLSCVIFDEVHYMSDSERGVVWEETLILLPPTVQLVLLSATLPNAMELADWLGRTRGQPIYVIATSHRPVPLEHYLLPMPLSSRMTPLPLIVSSGSFSQTFSDTKAPPNSNSTKDLTTGDKHSQKSAIDNIRKANNDAIATNGISKSGGHVSNTVSTGDSKSHSTLPTRKSTITNGKHAETNELVDGIISKENSNSKLPDKQYSMEKNQTATITGNLSTGQGKLKAPQTKSRTSQGNITRVSAPSNGLSTFVPSHIRSVLTFVQKFSLLPSILFIFSRKRCQEALESLMNMQGLSLLSKGEAYHIHQFINRKVIPLLKKEEERNLHQVVTTLQVLRMGIATHHSGLLPILKETIEILFSKGLVKILIATETFAMGVNMPAKSVIFGEICKPDMITGHGRLRRLLTSAEYTQMAGRAGRRGIDARGMVFVCQPSSDFANSKESSLLRTKQMITEKGIPLQSQFRLTYNTILQLIRRTNSSFMDERSSAINKGHIAGLSGKIRNSPHEICDVGELMKKSFYENASQRSIPARAVMLRQAEDELASLTLLSCPFECDDFEVMEMIRSLVDEEKNSNNGLELLPGMRIVLLSPEAEFLQPGLLLSLGKNQNLLGANNEPNVFALENSKSNNGTRSKEQNLVQALIFPIDKTRQWKRLLERPIDPNSETSIHTLSMDQFIVVDRDPVKLYSPSSLTNDEADHLKEFHQMGQNFKDAKSSQNQALFSMAITQSKGVIDKGNGSLLAPNLSFADRVRLLKHSYSIQLSSEEDNSLPGGAFIQMSCPDFSEHYRAFDAARACQQKVDTIKWHLSTDSLALLPEYRSRIVLLERCNFILITDQGPMITLKGRIACEIQTADEMLVTELLVERLWHSEMPAEDIVALLSVFVFQTQSSEEQDLNHVPEHLLPFVKQMRAMAKKLGKMQLEAGLSPSIAMASYDKLNVGLVSTIYAWATGVPFSQLSQLTETQEGIIVRTVLRLDETCRDVRNAARIMGDTALQEKMLQASTMIKRDICYLRSLYVE